MKKKSGTTSLSVCAGLLLGLHIAPAAVTEAWVQRYNSPANSDDRAQAMAVDGSGHVVVTGSSQNLSGNADYYTARYAATNGALLWERYYNAPANRDDRAQALALDGGGNVIVTGSSDNSSGNADYLTVKYAAATGAWLWERRFIGPAGGDDYATAVAVDGNGNVVVTGSSQNFSGNADYYTAKYAGANGALLWERRYSGPAGGNHFAAALALDASGNVLVTGQSWNGTNDDFYTVKYAAADGALLWEQRFIGPANRDDLARAVAVDGNGNVLVTGASHNGTNYDCYTAKYATTNGALLWEQRFNGPANRDDYTRAVAVDGEGQVLVTGYSNNETNADYYTARYAATNGVLLWEQRYNSPANGDDEAVAVTVDGSGSVYVTGSSAGSNGVPVYVTVSYDRNGNELWLARYDGGQPAVLNHDVRAIALDAARHVYVTGSSGNDFATIKYLQTVVAVPPIIIAQPAGRTVRPGTNVSLSVGVFGTAPFIYQWRRDGTNLTDGGRISGAAGSVLNIANTIESDSGVYSVVVSNDFGTATSSNATITISALDHFSWSSIPSLQFVNEPFLVSIQARDSSNNLVTNYSGPAALSATAPGDGISGSILAATNHSDVSSGNYTLGYSFTPDRNITVTAVRHYFGTKVSIWTDEGSLLLDQLVVSVPGTWVETPVATPILLVAGTRYRVASQTGGGIYFWRNDGGPNFSHGTIGDSYSSFGNTFPTFSDSVRWWLVDLRYNVSVPVAMFPTNSGNFTNGIWSGLITVSHAATNLSLQAADLTGRSGLSQPIQIISPGQAPVILTQPASQATVTGAVVNLSVSVYAAPPLAWQWRFHGTNLPGATNATLFLAGVTASQSGEYSVTVTNLFGSATSSNALVSVFDEPPFFDDFEPGIDPQHWSAFSPTVQATNYGGSVSGVNALWFGGTGSRFAQTRPINTVAGGVLDFQLILSDGEDYFWEVVDLPQEGVVLEYSTTGGATWVEFGRYDTSLYFSWKHLVVNIPTAARTASTQFRWRQLANSGAYSDHWALDNVAVIIGPQPGPAIRFAWSNIPSPQITNLPFVVTLQMRNSFAQIITNFSGTVALSGVAGGSVPITPAVSGNFTNGVWSGLITVLNPATNLVLRADDGDGNYGESNPFHVIRSNQPPIIVTQPAAQTVSVGSNAIISVGVVGSLPLFYTWRRNGTNLVNGGRFSGVNTSTLTILNSQESDSGLYSVFVGNAFGSVLSAGGTLTVSALQRFSWAFISSPVSTLYPFIVTVRARDFTNGVVTNYTGTVSFSASIAGSDITVPVSPPVSGAFVNGVWRGSLSITEIATNVVLRAEASSGFFGFSAPIDTAPIVYFAIHPFHQNVRLGTNVTLTALAVGTGPVRYQWRFEGTNLLHATNTSYSFTGANFTNHHGNFSVVAMDDFSTTVSSNAQVYLMVKPGIVTHITSQTVLQGGTATFSLAVTGAPPIWYRWIRNGAGYATTSIPVLVITNVQASGTIRVAATNRAAQAGTFSPGPTPSRNVILTMLPDFDRDGMADAWEALYGFNTNNAADALLDSDGDGISNRDEYRAGTHPADALNVLKILRTETNANVLQFVAQPNLSYTVQWQTNLIAAAWSTLTNITPQPAVRTVLIDTTDAPPGSERYYRIVTPMVP